MTTLPPRKAIVIGATSGIGEALARVLAEDGYAVGLTGRRTERLEQLAAKLPTQSYTAYMDVAEAEAAMEILENLLKEMGDVELLIINAGVSLTKPGWEREKPVIDINVRGFSAMADVAMRYFEARGGGHLVGISSVAAFRGFGQVAAYCASKAYVSTYLEGLQQRANRRKANITVTDVKPGYVVSEMTEGRRGLFWLAPVDKAARQIHQAIRRKKRHVYITKRWRLAGWVLKAMPDWIFLRIPA